MERFLSTFTCGLICMITLPSCTTMYRAEPIEAWVVDSETGQPVEGVVVTANWELEIGTVGGNVPVGQIMVIEAVTDKDGRFSFPAWGPKWTPLEMPNPMKSPAHLVNRDPQLLFFKSGYKWFGSENNFTVDYNTGTLRKSDWNGKTIKIQKWKGNLKDYSWSLSLLSDSMGFAFRGENCEWKNTPRMLALLFRETEVLQQHGAYTGGIRGINQLPGQSGPCGSARDFLKEYLK